MRKYILVIGFIFLLKPADSQISIYKNQQLLDSIEICVDYIYNYQFGEAQPLIRYIGEQSPKHPISTFLWGMLYYWQNFPLTPANVYSLSFVDSLERSVEISYGILEDDSENPEVNLLLLTGRSFLMMYYADNKIYRKAFEHIYPGYKLTMKSFYFREHLEEFNYYTGLFNYYREEYPKAHPMYKPLVYFLRDGNTEKGLEELYYTSQNCIFMDTEAYVFLIIIYLNYENNPLMAKKYAEELYNLKSNNRYFLSRLIETKLMARDTTNIEGLLEKLFRVSENDQFTLSLAYIYKGIFEEKYNQNYTIALYDYKKGLKLAEKYDSYLDSFKVYAYLGLSRIYELKQNHELAEEYFEKAENLAIYDYFFNDY